MSLYQRHNYTNKDVEFLINDEIIEYDMKSAGFNLVRQFSLLPDDKIASLEALDKKSRQYELGLIQKDNPEFGKRLNQAFVDGRKLFFEANGLNHDNIISIKKDAIFTTTRCHVTEFEPYLTFVPKNLYTSFYRLGGHEFYYNKELMHVKGISDELLHLHDEYMLDFLGDLFYRNEHNTNQVRTAKYIREFADYYRAKQLDVGYYRELNRHSVFLLNGQLGKEMIGVNHVDSLDNVDITYNYMAYIVPLISIYI